MGEVERGGPAAVGRRVLAGEEKEGGTADREEERGAAGKKQRGERENMGGRGMTCGSCDG